MKSIFVEKDAPYADENTCKDCRWTKTVMCPLSCNYVGRPLFDPMTNVVGHGRGICHRFVVSDETENARQALIMKKLQENLIIDD